MQVTFNVGSLVRLVGSDLVWKIIEIWDISYYASVTNKIIANNKYVITNVSSLESKVVDQDLITAINVENGVEIKPEKEQANTKKKIK